MARVTTLIYKATGRRPRSNSSGTPTGTTTLALPRVTNDQVFYPPSLVQDGLLEVPLVENAQTFYGPIVTQATPAFVSPPLTINTQTFFGPTVNQSIQLPLVTNTEEFFAPQVINDLYVELPLVTNSQTFYAPQLNQRMDVPLVTNEQTFYDATILQGSYLVVPLVANDQTFYGPTLNQKITVPLVNNTQTFHGITVTTGQIVRVPFWANGQAFYPPQVNQTVRAGFVNNTQTFYPIVVSANQLLVVPTVTNTQTFYGPSVQQKVTVPLVTNSSEVFAPAVIRSDAQLVSLPLTTNTQTFYAPKVNQSLRLSKVTNTQTFYGFSVSPASIPGYLLSTPGLVVTSAAGDPPQVDLTLNADHYAGYYIDIQRSTTGGKNVSDGSYVTQTLNIAHQIEPEELAALAITNTELIADGYTNPSGAYFQQYRIRREDGALSAWVEISGTVTASVAQLHTLAGFNRATSLTYPSTGHEFEIQNIEAGSLRKARATISATGKKQFEVTLNAWSANASRIGIGIDDGSYDFTTGGLIPGNTSLPNGICFRASKDGTGQIYAGGAIVQSSPANASIIVGDTVSAVIDTAAATIKFYRTRSGSTVQIGTTVAIGFGSTVYAFGGCERADNIAFNFGASAFTRSLDTGFTAYG